MSIHIYHLKIVDEHHVLAFVRMHDQPYLIRIAFEKEGYYLADVVHPTHVYCGNCRQKVEENTACMHFSFHHEDIEVIERAIEQYMPLYFAKKELFTSYPFQPYKSEQAKNNQQNIIQLNILAIHREEQIVRYGSTFDYYATEKDGKTIYVTLEQKERKRKPRHTVLLDKLWIEKFIAKIPPVPDKLKQAEDELIKRYDVSLTKWNKTMHIIEALKKCISLYTVIYEQYKHPSFQDLIIYLHEMLYREIPLREMDDTNFLKKHEQISAILQLYILNEISYQDCVNQLVKDPHDYLEERKERVIFGMKALLKTKEVYTELKRLHVQEIDSWHEELCILLINYIKIDCGIMFKTKEVQQQLEDFLLHGFIQVENGNWKENQLYYEMDQRVPFIHELPYEKINRYLQQINTNKSEYTFYIMEILFKEDFGESLARHIAYKYLDKIEVVSCDLFEEDHLHNWMEENERLALYELLKEFEVKPGRMRMWQVKNNPYPEMDEYILYNGEGLYRLHFRKEP